MMASEICGASSGVTFLNTLCNIDTNMLITLCHNQWVRGGESSDCSGVGRRMSCYILIIAWFFYACYPKIFEVRSRNAVLDLNVHFAVSNSDNFLIIAFTMCVGIWCQQDWYHIYPDGRQALPPHLTLSSCHIIRNFCRGDLNACWSTMWIVLPKKLVQQRH
jgi:hypothetical protein